MLGNLTIDKASMNISYFLMTIRIIANAGGRISRKDFVQQMASFIGLPAIKDGKENRTPYNKSKLPRYFGFVGIETTSDGNSFLVLTHRGEKLTEYIGENTECDPSERLFIKTDCRNDFIDLIFESVIFDSFGKNNCGAEQSNTDVEPPKIVFKTIDVLQKATAEEICYVMFGLNNSKFPSFEAAIDAVQKKRATFNYDYSKIMEEWKVSNIVNDCKIINIFTDDNIQLIRSERNQEVGKVFYYLNPAISADHLAQIRTIEPIYQPLRLFICSKGNNKLISQWVNDSVLGRVSNNRSIFCFEKSKDAFIGEQRGTEFFPGVFEKALVAAFQKPTQSIYVLFNEIAYDELPELFGKYYALLERVNVISSAVHGWSSRAVVSSEAYRYIVKSVPSAKEYLQYNEIKIPANIHFVGTKVMNEIRNDKEFDYKFTRVLLEAETQDNTGSAEQQTVLERVKGGVNKIYYGAPGCGKSRFVNDMIKLAGVKKENVIRVTFHPEFANCDFIGQILPTVETVNDENGETKEIVKYIFNPGPLTLALKTAYNTGDMVYLIIEEINRGNAAAIFGDMFQLLDRVRDTEDANYSASEYPVYNPNMQKWLIDESTDDGVKSALKDGVFIPSNLTIFATMNSSDQNVFTLDTAFKRRWSFEQISNDIEKDTAHEYKGWFVPGTDVTWETFLTKLNHQILENKLHNQTNEDKRLGKYFVTKECLTENVEAIADVQEAGRSFAYKVLEYIWNDVCKIGREDWFDVEEYMTLEELIEAFLNPKEGDTPLSVFQNIDF